MKSKMASESEQYSLKWNNFHSNMASGFHSLLEGENLVDVTIAAEGSYLQAHKVVLSVCSPYFQKLFTVNPSKHPIVILKDVKHKDLDALLQFMYKGEVNVNQEDLTEFLQTAEMLQIKGLTGEQNLSNPSIKLPPLPSKPLQTSARPPEKILNKHKFQNMSFAKPSLLVPTETSSATPMKRMKPNPLSAGMHSPVSKAPPLAIPSSSKSSSSSVTLAEPIEIKLKEEPVQFIDCDIDDDDEMDFKDYKQADKQSLTSDISQDISYSNSLDESSFQDSSQGLADFSEPYFPEAIQEGGSIQNPSQGNVFFMETNRGTSVAVFNRYMYYPDSRIKSLHGCSKWRCVDRQKTFCKALCVIKGSQCIRTCGHHNHDFHDERIKKTRRITQINRAIQNRSELWPN